MTTKSDFQTMSDGFELWVTKWIPDEVENIKGVEYVVRQETKDYEDNIRRFQPDIMVHGKDWREGPLAETREKAIKIMAEWGGEIVEPDYTQGISSSVLKEKAKNEGALK